LLAEFAVLFKYLPRTRVEWRDVLLDGVGLSVVRAGRMFSFRFKSGIHRS